MVTDSDAAHKLSQCINPGCSNNLCDLFGQFAKASKSRMMLNRCSIVHSHSLKAVPVARCNQQYILSIRQYHNAVIILAINA